ncbi:MAG: hypothetical protein A2Y10_05320 [Planctomycetes bacterium GWF2_41_51]|nr:MAG: hypothetical protein A2Y10_05320 [Planctomycetes bacterium GWF2_41_51]HBG25516.1 hypothetical protein [Phycisphaerales bacterium]
MLISAKYLTNYKIESKDGNIGQVHSFLFDDEKWIIRYLVVDIGNWLTGRKVLIVPSALGKPEGQDRVFPVELSREEISKSPDISTDQPISRQQEHELHKYYNWAAYWGGPLGLAATPIGPVPIPKETQTPVGIAEENHLRSTKEVIGYTLHASDGKIGRVDDFIIHQENWIIRYMVVDTTHWIAGKKVLIPPDWIKEISWSHAEVSVDVSKETVKKSPEFNPAAPVNREYEIRLYDYYGRPKYWSPR